MTTKYYKTKKNYFYKITNKGKIRISEKEYKKAIQKKGGLPPKVNNINTEVQQKKEGLLYKLFNFLFPEEIAGKIASEAECGQKVGFYKSKLKICYNNKQKIIAKDINNNTLFKENSIKLEKKIKDLFKAIEDWKTYSSRNSGHTGACNWLFVKNLREIKRSGNINRINNINWILLKEEFPEPPEIEEKLQEYNTIFTEEIKQTYNNFFEMFKGIKIKSYCRKEKNHFNKEFVSRSIPLKFCFVVQHPNGCIMSLQEFANLFSNNLQYISRDGIYLYKKGDITISSKYPFSGITHYQNDGVSKEYFYKFDGNYNFNDDDVYIYNLKLFENSNNLNR